MLLHSLTNFELQRYYQNDAQLSSKNKPAVKQARQILSCICSRNNLPKIKDGAYVINLDKYKPKGTH